jgi:hypothetical protein
MSLARWLLDAPRRQFRAPQREEVNDPPKGNLTSQSVTPEGVETLEKRVDEGDR